MPRPPVAATTPLADRPPAGAADHCLPDRPPTTAHLGGSAGSVIESVAGSQVMTACTRARIATDWARPADRRQPYVDNIQRSAGKA